MLKRYRFFIAFFTCAVCFTPVVAHAYTNRNTAIIQVMNKAAGKTQTLNIPVGQGVIFEKLVINVRACKQSDPFKAENFYAFVEISKSGDGAKVYGNWMERNNPGKNPVQNPDYDAWLVKCE